MKAVNPAAGSSDTLADADKRIADLEAENARLRGALEQPNSQFPLPDASILESITDAFIALDQDFRYVWINSETERVFGVRLNELVGKSLWQVFPDLVPTEVYQHLQHAMAERVVLEFEHYYTAWQRWFYTKVYPTKEGGLALYSRDISEQKRAQSDLRRQALVLEQGYDAIITTDLGGNITRWSAGAQRIFGYSGNEVIGQSMQVLFFEDDRPAFGSSILPGLVPDGAREMELRTRRKSREECFIRLSLSPLRDEGREAYGVLAIAMDVTAQRQAEQALRESEERFRLAFMAVDGIVYDWFPQTGKVYRSGSLERIIGIGKESAEPSEQWWQARVHPDDAAASSLNVLANLRRDQNSYDTEFRMLHADGHWVHVSDKGFVIRDENGVPVRVVGSSHEISNRKKLEAELRETNQQLKFQADILAATNDAVIALNPDLTIRYCNAAAERIYGTRLEDVAGKPMIAMHGYAWLNKEDEQRSIEGLKRGSWKGEYIHILNDGSEIVVHSTVNVLPPESGGGMVNIIRDVTERKQTEMAAKHQAQQLERANEDLLHFAYAASHDLHAPLRTITSFSQLLAMKYGSKLGADGGEFVQWIVDAGMRMDAMLRDLLRFATVAGGEVELSESIPLAEALSTALASLRSAVEETQAVITHDALPAVAGDMSQLVQLFQNLVGNSLKYRKVDTPPRIRISAERKEREWVVSVRDNGLGFEAKYAERIFGVFQRLHDKEFAGTGIGLTICKRIVERRGGRIWADGKPGEGATFSFSIPDSTIAIQAAPAMDWGRVRGALDSRPLAEEPSAAAEHFDELFKLLDLAPAVVRNLDGTILVWTQGAERLFGWTEHEAVGKNLRELIGVELVPVSGDIEAALLRDGQWTGEVKARKRDGGLIWLAIHKVLFRDGSGRPQSVIEIHNNINAQKEAQQALARSSELRDLALNAARMGIWRWDSKTGVVEWSETLEVLLGMQPGSFEGTYEAYKKRSHPDELQAVEEVIGKALKSGRDYCVENRLRREDGSYCWVRGQGKVVFDEENRPAGLIGVCWDISDQKQREADRQFLLELSAGIARRANPQNIADVAVMEVAKYLEVRRCVYSESDAARKRMCQRAEYSTEGPPAVSSLQLDDYAHVVADLANNKIVVVSNVETDPRTSEGCEKAFLARGVRAFVLVPIHRDGTWLANLGVTAKSPREWQEREIALLHAVAQRLESAMEVSRFLPETESSATGGD